MEEAQQNQPILQEVPGNNTEVEVPGNNTEVKVQQEAESPRVNVSSGIVGGIRAVSTPMT